MKILKKTISLCLILLMLFTITPITTFASVESKVSTIAAGMQHSAAIKANKSLYTWGDNSFGQLGTGDTVNANQPVLVLTNAVSVSCGYYTTAAITSDGSLYMWGKNYYGIFGNGDVSDSLTPLKVAENVAAVSVGNFHTAIIKTDGTLYMTGNNNYGQLGTGDTMAYTVFTKIMDNCKYVSVGLHHTAVVTNSGDLYTFGLNRHGQLGNGDAYNPLPSPYPRKVMENIARVSCAKEHTIAITKSGDAYGFGNNSRCAIGSENIYSNVPIPQLISNNVISAATGEFHSALLLKNGDLFMCGGNYSGQLGVTASNLLFRGFISMENIAAVACGENHSLVVTFDGELYAFGSNQYGQLGSAQDITKYTTSFNKIAENVREAKLSDYSAMLITEDDKLYAWGDGTFGQLGDGKISSSFVPKFIMNDCVSAGIGARHGASVTTDGTLYQWGSFYVYVGNPVPDVPQMIMPTPILENCVQVDCGTYHTAAITNSGDLYVWGSNYAGQVGVPGEPYYTEPQLVMRNIVSVACSEIATFAINNKGELYAWGANVCGELGIQDESRELVEAPEKIAKNVATVAADYSHTMIMKTNGEVYAFGVNSSNAFGFTTDTQYVHEHTRVFEDYNVRSVSCGVGHTSFITKANNLYTVGLNYFGQIGDGTTTNKANPVLVMSGAKSSFAGNHVTAVIDTDGALYAVGLNGNALCGLPNMGSVLFVMDGMKVSAKKSNISYAKPNYGLHIIDDESESKRELFTFEPDDRAYDTINKSEYNEYANCYDYLTPYEKHMYESLDRAVPDTHDNIVDVFEVMVPFISLSNQASAPFSSGIAAWYAYCYDHPEAFWLNSYSVDMYFSFYRPNGEEHGFAIEPMFDSAAEVALAEATINQKIDVIINGDDNDMYEKLRKAYDYVVSLSVPNSNTYSENPLEHSAYAVFCDDELSPLPAAYASAMKIICDRLGIYSVITRGRYEERLVYWLTVKADDGKFYVLDAYQEAKDGSDCFLTGASFIEEREYSIGETVPNMCYPTLSNDDYVQGDYEMYEYERTPIYSRTYNPNLTDIPNTSTPENGKSYILACEFNGRLYALRADNTSYAENMAKGMSAVDITSIDSINDSSLIWKVIEDKDSVGFELENSGGKLSAYSYLRIKEPGKNGSVFSYDASTGILIDTKDRCLRLFTAIMDNPVFDSKIRGRSDCDYSRIVLIEYVWQTGDVNMDCIKNTGDATMILKHHAGMITLDKEQKSLADMNDDGIINTGDAVAILQSLISKNKDSVSEPFLTINGHLA